MNKVTRFLSKPTMSLAFIATISLSALNYGVNADPTSSSWIQETRTEASLKIADALLAGKISIEEAAEKMIAFEEVLTKQQDRWEQYKQHIEKGVEDGEMTREEANVKYEAFQKGIDKWGKADERGQSWLEDVAGKLKAAVAKGEITEEQGVERFEAAKKQLEARMGAQKSGNARAEAYLKKVGTEIREAIANGEMSPEEGKARYAAAEKRMKQRLGGEKSKKMTQEEYDQGVAKMIQMVKAGEITREQMEARLNRMKKAMGGERGASDADRRARRARYQAAADKMAEMVKAGEITREQMEARLNRMKKAMGGNKSKKMTTEADGDRAEISDDCMTLRRKIGEAVRNGDMTRKEAAEIWADEGC